MDVHAPCFKEETSMTRVLVMAAVIWTTIVFASGAEAACPIGSYPWVDQWGNNICKRFASGSTSTIEGTLERCPTGSYLWVDSWGNRICRSFGSGADSYDTSRGCPVGFYPWIDSWGNRVCKSF
jgi:hypothetical protein